MEWAAESADNKIKQMAGDIVSLRDENRELRDELRAVAQTLGKAVTAVNEKVGAIEKGLPLALREQTKATKAIVAAEVHEAKMDVEKELGVALITNARKGATGDDDGKRDADKVSVTRQLSRHSEHLGNLETRVKKLERE